MKILNDLEAKALYQVLESSIDPRHVFLQILFESGARVSESLHLHQLSLVGVSLAIAPLKGSNPRQVTITPNLAAKLRRLPATLWSDALSPTATLASRRRGLDRHCRALTKAVLGREIHLHTLRHTAFSRLYAATLDLMLVKEWAGHRSVNSTVVYVHLHSQAKANQTHEALLKRLGSSAD